MPNEYLVHYGVRGMKWGIQKKQEELSDRQTAYRQKKQAQSNSYKEMTTSQRKLAKVQDAVENEKDEAEIAAIQEEIVELTNQLAARYDRIRLEQINAKQAQDKAARIIKKLRIKKATIV